MDDLERHNHWTLLRFHSRDARGSKLYLCRCDCGFEAVRAGSTIRSGKSSRCHACAIKKNILKHGQSGTHLYHQWRYMIRGCYNPKQASYRFIGALGATVFEPWLTNFDAWEKDLPDTTELLSLDRMSYFKPYEPGNIEWKTTEEIYDARRAHLDVLCTDKFHVEQYKDLMETYRHDLLQRAWVYTKVKKAADQRWRDFAVFQEEVGLPPKPYGKLVQIKHSLGYRKGNVRWTEK
jgi:hypothetical protein